MSYFWRRLHGRMLLLCKKGENKTDKKRMEKDNTPNTNPRTGTLTSSSEGITNGNT